MTPAQNRANAVWLRDQLEELSRHVSLFTTPLPPTEICAALNVIADGGSWRAAIAGIRGVGG